MKLTIQIASIALVAAFASCTTPSTSLRKMNQSQHDDMLKTPTSSEDMRATEARTRERVEKVRALLKAGEVKSADDHLNAAMILVQSNSEADFAEANSQGLAAAELGDERGFRVAAEAQDKSLLKRGMMQRYGTQFVWVPVLRAWRLHATDPRTTDVERKAMGVPPMAEILQQEKALNAKMKSGK